MNKKPISIKIDEEDLTFLKSNSRKYQKKINELIKNWIQEEKSKKAEPVTIMIQPELMNVLELSRGLNTIEELCAYLVEVGLDRKGLYAPKLKHPLRAE